MSDIRQETLIEKQPIPVPIEGMKTILYQLKYCTCKIYPKNGKKGTGFFCNIPSLNNYLPVLITNNHVLNANDIDNNKIIELIINNEVKEIEIDNSRKKYTNPDKNIDITIIEIKPNEDKINYFLELDEKEINKNKKNLELESVNKSIYILHYPKGELNVSFGIMQRIIDSKKIYHFCNTEDGSSGGPILSLEGFKVIGIHFGYKNESKSKINCGTFIKYAIYLFNTFIENQIIISKTKINKYPLVFGAEKKTIYKNMYKMKESFSSSLNEFSKFNYNEKNNYNYNNYIYNKDISFIQVHNNNRKIRDLNSKNNLKIYYTNPSRNPKIKYSNQNIMKNSKITNSYINDNDIGNKTERKKYKSKNIYNIKQNFPIYKKQSQNKDFKSHNQSTSSQNIKNKMIEYKSNQKINKINNNYNENNNPKIKEYTPKKTIEGYYVKRSMSRYLNEIKKKRILSEKNFKKNSQNLKFKYNKLCKSKTNNLKLNKISLNKKIENDLKKSNNCLSIEILLKKKKPEERNKSFNKTEINFIKNKNLMKKEEKVNDQIPFLINAEKSKRDSFKSLNINNKVSLSLDFNKKEKIDKNHSFLGNKVEIYYKKLFDEISESKIKNLSKKI